MKCQTCKKRKVDIEYAESALDWSHGFKKMICNECYLEILLTKKKNLDKTIKGLKQKLGGKK